MTEIEYNLVRKKVKNASIRISSNLDITITVPVSYTQVRLDNLIADKSAWISKTLTKLSKRKKDIDLKDNEVLLFGEKYTLTVDPTVNNKILTYHESKKIVSNHEITRKSSILVEWYIHLAKKEITRMVSELAGKYGFEYSRIFIRDQKTKWGTCSSRKNLSFNWRLIRCPRSVIEYLIIHELSHLKEMNHSKRFWELVESMCPDFKKSKLWLKEYESYLFSL
ncbi:MAG: M48 family metallopeptidase [Ignavibacteria bacterium]